MTQERRDWRELCEAIVEEQDPEKLFELTQQLITALDELKSNPSSNAPQGQSLSTLSPMGAGPISWQKPNQSAV
jgi:hypothetical protein